MRHFAWRWLAISSVVLGALLASAETRPQYGGTLHVVMRGAPSSLDPGDSKADSFSRRTILSLLFDTLVTADSSDRVTGQLALSWETLRGSQRMQFRLRPGVKLADGTLLTAEIAASSLRRVNPSWNVLAEGDSIVIDSGGSEVELLRKLSLPQNAIVKRDADNKLSGTGPFQVADWQPGKRLTLSAREDCWRGRPFLDEIEISLGTSFRDPLAALELGKAEIAEIAPEQANRIPQERFRVARSSPIELLALGFPNDAPSDSEKNLREALRLSIERTSMHSVLLQGVGEPTAALLPTWMSGYGFVFSTEADLAKARQLRATAQLLPNWTLAYDSSDPLARLLAERIALNARDAGLSLRPAASGGDLRLMRIPLVSADPWISLHELLEELNMLVPQFKGPGMDDLYQAEHAALATERVIPLFHLPEAYAAALNLNGWAVRADGSLDFANAWLKNGQP